MVDDSLHDYFSSLSDDEHVLDQDSLPPMLLQVLFTQDGTDLIFRARFVLVSLVDGSPLPVSAIQPVRIPLARFRSNEQKAAYGEAVKNNLSDELPKVLGHTVAEEIKKAINEAAASVGVSGELFAVRAEGLKQRIKSDTKFQKRRVNVRGAGAPLVRTPAALRREVKRAAIRLRRLGRTTLKLCDVAAELERTESALSRDMERKGVSWKAIKAEVKIPT
jgi:hypothetical protein